MSGLATSNIGFSGADGRWSLIAALTWIATRSLKFAERFADANPVEVERFIFEARRSFGAPHQISYAAAFHALVEQIDSRSLTGRATIIEWASAPADEQLPVEAVFASACVRSISEGAAFEPRRLLNALCANRYKPSLGDFEFHSGDCLTHRGSGAGSPNLDGSRTMRTWRRVTFESDDIIRLWPDWPVYAAWKEAKAADWKGPRGLSPAAVNSLPPGDHVSLSSVVDLLAFGRNARPLALFPDKARVERLRAGLALLGAGQESRVTLHGCATSRLPNFRGCAPIAELRQIEPGELVDQTLVIDGGRNWIGPRSFADDYPEIGRGANSVSFVDVIVHRESVRRWLLTLSGKPAAKRPGPKESYPWAKIEAELARLMDYHGAFTADDPQWNAQARLEERLMQFCEQECQRSPSISQLRTRIAPWLEAWRAGRK